MKDDVAPDVPCPLACGKIFHPRTHRNHTRNRTLTPRSVVRQVVRQHLNQEHAGLTSRQVSLLCDQVVERLALA